MQHGQAARLIGVPTLTALDHDALVARVSPAIGRYLTPPDAS